MIVDSEEYKDLLLKALLTLRIFNGKFRHALQSLKPTIITLEKLMSASNIVCTILGVETNKLTLSIPENDLLEAFKKYIQIINSNKIDENIQLDNNTSMKINFQSKTMEGQSTNKNDSDEISDYSSNYDGTDSDVDEFDNLAADFSNELNVGYNKNIKSDIKEVDTLLMSFNSSKSSPPSKPMAAFNVPPLEFISNEKNIFPDFSRSISNDNFSNNLTTTTQFYNQQLGSSNEYGRYVMASHSNNNTPRQPEELNRIRGNSNDINRVNSGRMDFTQFYKTFWEKVFNLFFMVSDPAMKCSECLVKVEDIALHIESTEFFPSPAIAIALDIVVQVCLS